MSVQRPNLYILFQGVCTRERLLFHVETRRPTNYMHPAYAPCWGILRFCTQGESMTFRIHQAQYDDQTESAYVEVRRGDGDGVNNSSWLYSLTEPRNGYRN